MDISQLSFVWCHGLDQISPADWQVVASSHPMLDYHFLRAFELSMAVGEQTGWMPYHLVAFAGERLLAAAPCYIKTHSYGEYVFDWSWADAYEQAGGQYYPKLICAIPFSPVTGPRLLIHPDYVETKLLTDAMLANMQAFCQAHGLSGVHILFPDDHSAKEAEDAGWLRRNGVQFRWENHGYPDWETFLSTLNRDKRKKIRQERLKVIMQGVTCREVSGLDVSEAELDLFYQCYCHTYHRHGSKPYLPKAFFEQISRAMPEQFRLFIATQGGEDVAASLCILGGDSLYGRYWGSLREISCLHFELCYYQPQLFCIREGIRYFEGGAQGVHKLARGFSPYPTCSYHHLTHPDFHQSVARFLKREANTVQHYVDELEDRSPYKNVPSAE